MTTNALFEKGFGGESVVTKVLAFTERYRIANVYAVASCFFSYLDRNAGVEAARSCLDELAHGRAVSRLKGRSQFAKDTYQHADAAVRADYDLARLWYCVMSGARRHLLTFDELRELFQAEGVNRCPHQNYSHVVSDAPGGDVLYRIYHCTAKTPKSVATQLNKIVDRDSSSFHEWVQDGTYGVAVLVHTDSKAEEVRRIIKRCSRGQLPLDQVARITVAVVPDTEGYNAAVAALHDTGGKA